MLNIFSKIFGSSNDRTIRKMQYLVDEVNKLADEMSKKDDEFFTTLKDDLFNKYHKDKNINAIIPLAYAAVREASVRTLGLRHFDSQLFGGICLAEGNIAEMKTGEGKTLVATLPAFLNASIKNKVVLVTVNDYLAKRDADWMRPIYEFLGLSVGTVYAGQSSEEKIASYKCDIIYATNNELGFDYLRDNMALSVEDRAQCSLDFAIVDEVDSILIDEARTPLIISGPSNESSELYKEIKKIIPKLQKQLRQETEEEPLQEHERGHYIIDEKNRSIELTDDGYILVESELESIGVLAQSDGLYSVSNLKIMRFVQATLRASFLFNKNVHYLVRNNEVLLIDEHTGRTMHGRRMSEGVHQALECKENVPIQRESQTLASTTFQNFFRLFDRLSGMTGTADTEALEFKEIYGLDVVVIPTHKPMIREDKNDLVFLTKASKYKALINEIDALREKMAPILVGTVSVESSEEVAQLLQKRKIPHQILNAKHHEKEAEIIANAGKAGMVTIATNMAGRGTDIVLGGKKEEGDLEWEQKNKQVLSAGGLHILGTERHESRRIDNQLRGRSGRQGDPGYSQFFLSLDDDLLRLFISDNRRNLFERVGLGEDHIEHRMLSRGIENAQRRIENRNFDIRKNLLEYDDVANDQRQAIYSLRNQLLEESDISETIDELIDEQFKSVVYDFIPMDSVESQWELKELEEYLLNNFGINTDIENIVEKDKTLLPETIADIVKDNANNFFQEKYSNIADTRLLLEKQVMLQVLDVHWKEHLAEIDHLRQSIGLRAYAQKNPKNEYKREAYAMFEEMLDQINKETIRVLFTLQLTSPDEITNVKDSSQDELELRKDDFNKENINEVNESKLDNIPITREEPKFGRNEVVKITNGIDTKEMKYKKAKLLIETGEWKVI
ncbi:MAG: preprotein translocase subunit SecA [Gammaproteobacteria bacterium]|uniref:Protein translocase subunit SecA n=1 Tax=SAR86 cluster bacterium TaxID=2030880 RepID=A0A368C879_9GAMM|nr:MAG: preprotein translocase subunit SecA [SAR86 cluster bacterium]